MSIACVKDLLNKHGQRFVCKPAGNSPEAEFTALIHHQATSPISDELLKSIEAGIGYQEQLFAFLKEYGSLKLYCDRASDESAFYLAPPEEWQQLHGEFLSWVDDLDETEKSELLPPWIDNAIVIGEIPSSGNYFLFLIEGDEKGKVFEFEHDGFEFIQVGESLNEFLKYICTVTDDLIKNISSHTRYSDGKTDIQWLATNYEYDQE